MQDSFTIKAEKKTIHIQTRTVDTEWINYISSNPEAVFYHHPLWLNALEKETGNPVIRLTARNEDNKICGILPLQKTAGMYLGMGGLAASQRLSSLPRTPVAGIVADDENTAAELLAFAEQLVRNYKGTALQVKSDEPAGYKSPVLKIIPWRENYRIQLPSNEEDIRFGNPRNHRRIKWAVNKALSEGVLVRRANSTSDYTNWYTLYLETSRWHAVPPRSFDFFLHLFNSDPSLISLLIAEREGEILAGSLFLMFNQTVFYSFNGRNKQMLNLRPNDIIQYHAIYKACRDGYKYFDMGEVAGGQEGLSEFKKKWGCESKPIYHVYYFPNGEINNTLMSEAPGNLRLNVWRRIPIRITEKLGQIINKRL